MSTATSTAQPADRIPTGPTQGGQARHRPRNRNRGGNAQSASRNAQIQPPPAVSAAASTQAEVASPGPSQTNQRRGGKGRGRGGVQGQQRGGMPGSRNAPRFAGGRQFGGELTVENDAASTISQDTTSTIRASAQLQGDAPTFEPGKPVASRKKQPLKERKPQAPKSSAPDITTRIHEDINNGHYECAICTEEVRRTSRAWSCRTCWTVFHLGCIKKWSQNEGSAAARQQAPEGELPPPRQWRCPGCNLPKDVLPKNFSCWCEKEIDPKPLSGIPPFSCGQTCSRERSIPKKCPHPCPSICHAGPCSPCTQMGPTQYCFCGKKAATRRCLDTDYEKGWSCGDTCGELMPCGEHYCPRPCHEGLCGACEVRIPARCYCGQSQKDILCCDRGDEHASSRTNLTEDGTHGIEHWTGVFECPDVCGRWFDCGKHQCQKPCHVQSLSIPHCPKSPDVVTHCPCGKTPLSEISDHLRQSCEEPIPNCQKPCGKLLSCGHECKQLCHQGDCNPCLQSVSIACRCGRTTSTTICHQGTEEPPQCMRVCRVSLNCGRHECGEHCCAGERKAAERQSSRRKLRPLNSAPSRHPDDSFEAEHICTRSCDRQLKCGNLDHRCQELCHRGVCGTCREAIFEEISCNCGRTVLQPPLPCGTKPPPCQFQCERRKACGHSQVAHNCHQDDESCPNCPFLTTKPCLCGKNSLKNQPCWLNEVRCGEICGRKLKCGAHKCQKQCHRPGECEEPCAQPCGKELNSCGHPCMAPCHSPMPCKEDKACQHKILITCECQRIKQETKCNASKTSEGNTKRTLKCDDECARLERNRKLALALNIDTATHQDDHIPYSAETMNLYLENSTWAAAQEKDFRVFAANPEAKRMRFKPMPAQQRKFLHSIAEDFGFDSESMDPEPHRHVAIFKTPRFVMAPMKTLAECARIRQVQRVTAPPQTSIAIHRPKASNLTGDPFNALLITKPRFALTMEEVNVAVRNALPNPPFQLEVHFLPSEEVALRPPLAVRVNIPEERELQASLESIKSSLTQAIANANIGKLQLARLDSSLNVMRRESDSTGPGAGWSQVAAAKRAPNRTLEKAAPLGNKGGFAVLSLSSTRKKKEKQKETEVVEDWEAAEIAEEEKERVSAAASAVQSEDEGRISDGGSAPPSTAFALDGHSDGGMPKRWADMEDDE